MATDMGRGIIAPDNSDNIGTGASEMRRLGATTAAAINNVDLRVSNELATKLGKAEAYRDLVPRDEAVQYGIEGPRGPEGPRSEIPGPPGPGGSIALEETDPGCFVDSEVTWLQWPQSGGLPAVWNPNTETYENPIRVDTSVGTRVFVGDTMIHGDTGRRSMVSELINGWTTGLAVNLYRTNDTVTLELQNGANSLDGSNATSDRFLNLPTGFRPGSSVYVFVGQVMGGSTYLPLNRTTGADLTIPRGMSNVHGMVSWKTTDPWPTSLPGTPG